MDHVPSVGQDRTILERFSLTLIRSRHADRIASFWLQRLRDSNAAKRLNLLYLVNEIVQNSRARRKDDFPNAFSPIMPEAAQTAYRSSTTEVQNKIRRLVEVWRARNVFEVPIQDAIEARLDDVDKTRPAGKKPLMGGSLFGSSTGSGGLPKELETLAPLQIVVSKANLSTTSTVNTGNTEYDKLNDSNIQLPAPPLHAARLSALMKSLAMAESSVAESVKARKALILELENILEINRTSLAKDETTLEVIQTRISATEIKRREVEDSIRRTANAESEGMYNNNGERSENFTPTNNDMNRPEYEALTPPPVEALTPIGSPNPHPLDEPQPEQPLQSTDPNTDRNPDVHNLLAAMSSAGASIPPRTRPATQHTGMGNMNGFSGVGSGGTGNVSKKRKVGHSAELPPGFGLDLDEDVAEMIRQESGGFGGDGSGNGVG
jgi:regulator of Ty1 transposition protein 103